MATFYRLNDNDYEGIYISPENCINYIEVFRPIDTDFLVQQVSERRCKGFYKYVDENKSFTLMTLDLMLDLAKQQHRPTIKEITTEPSIKYNETENMLNNYLVGYEEDTTGIKNYFITSFRELPAEVLFCRRNVLT